MPDKSLLITPHTHSLGSGGVHISKYIKRLAQPWPRINPYTPCSALLVIFPSSPVCLTADESIIQTRAPQQRCQSTLSSFIASPRSLGRRLCTCRHYKCHICWGFVNRHTFCGRWCEWDEVTNCWNSAAAAEGRGWGHIRLHRFERKGIPIHWDPKSLWAQWVHSQKSENTTNETIRSVQKYLSSSFILSHAASFQYRTT